jgi:adenylate cyclase
MEICTRSYKNKHTSARPALCKETTNMLNVSHNYLGDEKDLALMFLDIRNFTTFMASRSAYDVMYVIRELFSLFAGSIKQAGGRVIETAGDSIYAVFGLENDIKTAVRSSFDAATAIFRDLEVFNNTYAQPYFNYSFEIGVGLHAGEVVAAPLDLDFNDHLAVMGLPVNIASRLQSETKVLNNDLLVSERAYNYLKDQDDHEQRTVELKGIADPMQVRLMGQPYGSRLTDKPSYPDDLEYHIALAG